MHIALNLDVEVKDGTLVLTDRTGQTITFSKEQTAQKKVSMITLGELCGLPKRQLAPGFGFKTRKSYYDSRRAVLRGTPPTFCPNAEDLAAPRYARRRWKRSSSARVLKPMAICMQSLTP